MHVPRRRWVARVEVHLQGRREAQHRLPMDVPGGTPIGGVAEHPLEPRLDTCTRRIEDDRVQIDLATRGVLHHEAHRPLIFVQGETRLPEARDHAALVVGSKGQIQVTMSARLLAQERIDAPAPPVPTLTSPLLSTSITRSTARASTAITQSCPAFPTPKNAVCWDLRNGPVAEVSSG